MSSTAAYAIACLSVRSRLAGPICSRISKTSDKVSYFIIVKKHKFKYLVRDKKLVFKQ